MGKYHELFSKAMEKGSDEEAWELADELMDTLCKRCPDVYEDFMMEIEKIAYRIPKEEAERIVRNMRPKGQYWTYQQIVDFVREKGITGNWVNWYLVMNMAYNDYCDTARAYGLQNDPEFFFCLAKDFIEDPDAKPMKIEKYFLD